MPFELREITEEDTNKIIADSARDFLKHSRLLFAKNEGQFPQTWAIDRDQDSYLFAMPVRTHAERANKPYFAYMNGVMYQINCRSAIYWQVYFDKPTSLPPPILLQLQNAVRSAFLVYGRYGWGPRNKGGFPEREMNVEFLES